MTSEVRALLAQNLRLFRLLRDWSQDTLGRRAGLHRTYISQIERGLTNVSIDNLEKLADAFGVPISALLRPLGDDRT